MQDQQLRRSLDFLHVLDTSWVLIKKTNHAIHDWGFIIKLIYLR